MTAVVDLMVIKAGRRKRTEIECLAELAMAAQRFSSMAMAWQTFLPRAAALADGEAMVEGMGQLLREFRSYSQPPGAG